MRVVSPTANGATVVGLDLDSNPLNGFEAIGYTPATDFDSYDALGNLVAMDTIEYIVADYDPNKPVGNDAPDSWIRDSAGNLVLQPISLRTIHWHRQLVCKSLSHR